MEEKKNKIAPNPKEKRSSPVGGIVFSIIVIVAVVSLVNGFTKSRKAKSPFMSQTASGKEISQVLDSDTEVDTDQNEIAGEMDQENETVLQKVLDSKAYMDYAVSSGYRKNRKGLYELSSPVMDTAGIIDSSTADDLTRFLLNLDSETGIQLVVLTVNSLEGRSIEEFSMRYAEFWELGQKNVDNGILLTVAMDEREMRIETGYGTEGALTDAICSKIIRCDLVPNFKDGNYSKGIRDAVYSIAGVVTEDESLISPAYKSDKGKSGKTSPVAVIIVIVWIVIMVLSIGRRFGIFPFLGPAIFMGGGSNHHGGFGGGSSGGGTHFGGGGGHFGGGGASGHW